LTRDTWGGDKNQPMSYNMWFYGFANPVRYTDPSGHWVYDRASAVSYAMAWDYQSSLDPNYDFTGKVPEMDWSDQCTLFASSVLYQGGVRDSRGDPHLKPSMQTSDYEPPYWDLSVLVSGKWGGNNYGGLTWYNTPEFYKFASTVSGKTVLTYNNPPQYTEKTLTGWNIPLDKTWENKLLANRSSIQKGDLVFYGHGDTWDHVAVVVGWGLPTYFWSKALLGNGPSGMAGGMEWLTYIESLEKGCASLTDMPLRPLVVERSGSVNYMSFRSLDNTANQIQNIAIVHIENH